MKKIVGLLLCLAMVFAFASCKPTTGPDSDGGGKMSIDKPWWSTTGELEKDSNGVVFDNVSLSMMTVVNGADYSVLREILTRFNAEYNGKIRIDVSNTTQEKFVNLVTTSISNNQNPADIFMSHQSVLQALATEYKCIQPLNEAMEKSGIALDLSDYADALAKYADLGYTGYTFGIPVDAQSMVVLYNKDLLGDNPIPTNRSELLALCQKIKESNPDITPIVMPASEETETNFFAEYVWPTALLQNGATLYNAAGDGVDWATGDNVNAFRNAIESIRSLKDNGYTSLSDTKTSATNKFVSGKALFFVYEPWLVNNVIKNFAEKKGVEIEACMENYVGATCIAKWFAMDDTAACADSIFGDSHFFAMSKSVKSIEKKAAIVEFIKWFTTNAEVGADWAKAGHVSASKAVSANDQYKNDTFVQNYTAKFYPNIDHVYCAGNTLYYDTIFTQLSDLFIGWRDGAASGDADLIATKAKAVNDTISALKDLS